MSDFKIPASTITLMPVQDLWMDHEEAIGDQESYEFYSSFIRCMKTSARNRFYENFDEKQVNERVERLDDMELVLQEKSETGLSLLDLASKVYRQAYDTWTEFNKESALGYRAMEMLINHQDRAQKNPNANWVVGYRYLVAEFVRNASALLRKLEEARDLIDLFYLHKHEREYFQATSDLFLSEQPESHIIYLDLLDGTVSAKQSPVGYAVIKKYPAFERENMRRVHDLQELNELIRELEHDIINAVHWCSDEDKLSFRAIPNRPISLIQFFNELA